MGPHSTCELDGGIAVICRLRTIWYRLPADSHGLHPARLELILLTRSCELVKPDRRVVTGLSSAALALIVIGVAAVVFNSGFGGGSGASRGPGTNIPSSGTTHSSASPPIAPSFGVGSGDPGTPTPLISASPSASAGPTTHPVGFAQADAGFDYYADDGTIVPVKPVPGLEVRIQSGRAIYYAQAGNKLGLKEGSYAGEFMPIVSMAQTDGSSAVTGGIVLAGPAVSRLIADKLASIEADSDRWIVALPVDIRSASKAPVEVTFDRFGLAGLSNTPRVVVRFGGLLPVVEAVPTNGGFHVLVEQIGITSWQVVDPVRFTLAPDAIDTAHSMNELLIYGSGKPSIQRDVMFNVRAVVGSPMLTVSGDVCVSLVVNGSRAELGPDKILTIGDVPVFVASSS